MSFFGKKPPGGPSRPEVSIRRFGPGDAARLSQSAEAGAAATVDAAGAAMPAGAAERRSFFSGGGVSALRPGDFILTHSKGLAASLIRIGQRWRYWRAAERPFTHWNHAALVVSPRGDLIEAIGRGVVRTPLSHYNTTEFYLVRLSDAQADARDRKQMIDFAETWVGRRYGVLTIASIALSLLAGWKFVFSVEGQFICSGLVAGALERTSIIFERGATHMTPADLARHFDVRPGAGPSPKGEPPRPNWPP